jgi:hypothetical protein
MRPRETFAVVVRLTLVGASLATWISTATAQDAGDAGTVISDTTFVEKPKEPIFYSTSYDQNISRGAWTQTLGYYHNAYRVAVGVDANMNTVQALRGLSSDGLDGNINGRLDLRATRQWIWSLNGTYNTASTTDTRSTSDRRQNSLQLRTQYSVNPSPRLSGIGILFTEVQEVQSLGSRTIPGSPLAVTDTTAMPPDTTYYPTHSQRDSSYTSGRRDGISGTLNWKPAVWLEMKGLGSGTYVNSKTRTVTRDFWALSPSEGAAVVGVARDTSDAPNGDRRFESSAIYTGLKRTSMTLAMKEQDGNQGYFLLAKRDQERLSYDYRSASFHLEHAPLPGAQVTLDGTLGRTLQQYVLQQNLNNLVHTRAAILNVILSKEKTRASFGFQLGRNRTDLPEGNNGGRQATQTGTIINRAMNLGGARRITRRLWLDATGSVSLYSRAYDDKVSDRDDVRGYVNAGGGYSISQRCSTAVHFSTNRGHTVAIDPGASAGNNVQSTYQMAALLHIRVSDSFTIHQDYSINANYIIYDFVEARNSLTRIRRIDTYLSDSLFSFGFIRLTHNFYYQDHGSYTLDAQVNVRTYSIAERDYLQNVGVTIGVRPFRGITLSATQSLANSRNYLPMPKDNTKRNHLNLNLGAVVDRELPGDMTLQGSIQHIGEYTESPGILPPKDVVDYWLAGVNFTKAF